MNMYAVVWLATGAFRCHSGQAVYDINAPALLFFTPYQYYTFTTDTGFTGERLYFHGDFYCIERHKKEVACNGILFNNVYTPPHVQLDDVHAQSVNNYIRLLQEDMRRHEDATRADMVVAHLKILLIIATRLKVKQLEEAQWLLPEGTRPRLQELQRLIETHFVKWHKPADYAAAMFLSVKGLSRLTSKYLSKTPSELITERIIQEAKRALHFTTLSVKEIAAQLQFEDPYYFSRLFRKYTGVTPTKFREQVGVTLLE
jgi:AraC family transcriptional activator of pobA